MGMSDPRAIDGSDVLPRAPREPALAESAIRAPGAERMLLLRCEPLPVYSILGGNCFRYHSEGRSGETSKVRFQKV